MKARLKKIKPGIIKCDGLLSLEELGVLAKSHDTFSYGWKANSKFDMDQGHWNNLVVGPRNGAKEDRDLQNEQQFIDSGLLSVWTKLKMVYGERSLLRCYFNSYTYGTDGYAHTDVSTQRYEKYKEESMMSETLLLFCNDKWDHQWAGETVFFNEDKTEIEYATLPTFNRSICFDANIFHAARSPSRACYSLRKILAFKTLRRTYDEEKCIKYILDTMKNIPHSRSTFSQHLIGTYRILKQLNMPEDVCFAGLFHAVYGTEHFSHDSPLNRDDVRNLIGVYAEDLAYTFGTMKNRISTITEMQDPVKRYHLACIEYGNLLEQMPRIMVNGIHQVKQIIEVIREV